jgi:quinol monooxygenase YgiN
MSHVGLLVRLEAKPEKAEHVADFLKGALPLVQEEPATQAWLAIRPGPSTFGIYDAFPDDTRRKAHLSGRTSDMLMTKFPALLAKPPSIEQVDVLAAKFSE